MVHIVTIIMKQAVGYYNFLKEFIMRFYLTKIMAVLIVAVILPLPLWSADQAVFSIDPIKNHGKKWRIGYCEGGEYIDYKGTLIATVKGLMEIGWVEGASIPEEKGEKTDNIWRWLSTELKSDYIQYVSDAHYSANWDDTLRANMAEKIITRLNQKKDIDLMIAMGTWAGKDLANVKHTTPTMVLTASDAVGAGIIKNNQDSGFEFVHAHVDPSRYERQIRIFHDIVEFKKLGVYVFAFTAII